MALAGHRESILAGGGSRAFNGASLKAALTAPTAKVTKVAGTATATLMPFNHPDESLTHSCSRCILQT